MAVYYYGYWFRDDCLVSQATYLHIPIELDTKRTAHADWAKPVTVTAKVLATCKDWYTGKPDSP